MIKHNEITLGCGLIGIGRKWGFKESAIPDENDTLKFLQHAYDTGIRFFDTAPAYGKSEERLGAFLQTLSSEQQNEITIETKFGEHWNVETEETSIDHHYESLKKSLENSLKRLGKIDILLLHKTNPKVLASYDLQRAMEFAKTKGIKKFGASVSDIESGEIVCRNTNFSVIQFPFNTENKTFERIIKLAKNQNKKIIINRPFNMGEMIHTNKRENQFLKKVRAYKTILKEQFDGTILTGTKSLEHLEENYRAFNTAKMLLAKY